MLKQIVTFSCLILLSGVTSVAFGDDGQTFSPTWKLLNAKEKQQFMAGYIFGWKDAARVTDITIDYIDKNPGSAQEGLKSVRSLYNLAGLKPEQLVGLIDEFYSNPANGSASLSKAVSAAKSRVQ